MPRNHRDCPICGANPPEQIDYHNIMASIDSCDMSYDVVTCPRCGMSYATNIPTHDTYQFYYTNFSKYDTNKYISQSDKAVHNVISDIAQKLCDIKSVFLDIGCGCGHLLAALRSRGFTNLYGIDPSLNARNAAKELYGIDNIRVGDVENIDSIELNADVILMSYVLEHLISPAVSIRNIANIMKKNSLLCLAVPDRDEFNGIDGEPFGEFSLEHINYFSATALTNAILQSGLSIISYKKMKSKDSGTVIIWAKKQKGVGLSIQNSDNTINNYIRDSEFKFSNACKRIQNASYKFYIYGAGAHTARLLPRLSEEVRAHCLGIFDRNPNLQNHVMNELPIIFPDYKTIINTPIIISSFKSEKEIASSLKRYNTICLYSN